MARDFVIWDWNRNVKHAAWLDSMLNLEHTEFFTLGRPFDGSFPPNVEFPMDPEHPRDTVLTDYLNNADSLLVVSERLKSFLEARKLKSVEYHQVAILDHKGKPIAAPYFIAHTFDHVDCLNAAASQPIYSRVRKEAIYEVKRLVLDPERLDPERELFKVKEFLKLTLVSRDLASAIAAAKFTAIKFMELNEYDGDA